jgi:hypothetical protein
MIRDTRALSASVIADGTAVDGRTATGFAGAAGRRAIQIAATTLVATTISVTRRFVRFPSCPLVIVSNHDR